MPFLLLYNFTFHNVSINTQSYSFLVTLLSFFTFHNVSINTDKRRQHFFQLISLHSTMFLLIQTGKQGNICAFITFTFHNVSINTTLLRILLSHTPDFTFHNVSINTVAQSETTPMEEYPLHSTMFLLIPWFLFRWCKMLLTLHSTMFLLIPDSDFCSNSGIHLYIPQCFY